MALPKLGIVAGGGRLPAHLISACRATGREVFVVALEGHAEPGVLADAPEAWVRLGAAGTIIDLLHRAQVKELVFAGAVRRPSLAELRPDGRTVRFLATLGKGWIGDDSLLSALVREMENEGFRVVAPETLLDGFLAVEGTYGRTAPDEDAAADIARGVAVAKALGALDIGQAVVVQHGIVLGVEAAEGTDGLIRRCRALHREGRGGVLVKIRKPGQERRVDLPAIGPATVAAAAGARLSGIAVEAGGALVFDADALASAADAAGIFVIATAVPE